MPLSDGATFAIAIPATLAIYWRRGIIRKIRRYFARRNVQPVTNLPMQISALREPWNNTHAARV